PVTPMAQNGPGNVRLNAAGAPALTAGAGIVKTDTPGTFILAARPPAPRAGGSAPPMTGVPLKDSAPPKSVPEEIITAAPPPISTAPVRTSVNPKLVAGIATPQSLSLSAPPAPQDPTIATPPATGPVRAIKPPPVTEMPKPVYQVMPSTKPFGYSLVNNDVQVD